MDERSITLNTDMEGDPKLAAATLIHFVVTDFLHQNKFGHAHLSEVVDMAVIGMGLGLPRTQIELVTNKGSFWDTTQWDVASRPFLNGQSLAYVNAVSAWIRGDNNPDWSNELSSDVKRPMRKSLKYLAKTNDSFFRVEQAFSNVLEQTQNDWFKMAASASTSTQIIALRHLKFDEHIGSEQRSLLLQRLRSGNRDVVLHSIVTTDQMGVNDESIADELRALAEHRDDEIRAKAMCSLARFGALDEISIGVAANMLTSKTRFIVFAGLFALSSLESVPDRVLPLANRGLARAMQMCDYEFVGLFVSAFNRWLEDPEAYFEEQLQDDSPEFLVVALEALKNVREQLIALE